MRIIITGGSGLMGQYLNIRLSEKNEILSLYNKNTGNCEGYSSRKVDINDYKKLKEIFGSFKPDAVIHTASVSRPELCDELPFDKVFDTNVNSTLKIAELCNYYETKLIFTSTDLVYDGYQKVLIKEDEGILNPVSLYAYTKLTGENIIKEISHNYIILRVSLLYGLSLNNAVNNFDIMLKNFRNGKVSRLFFDQYRTPLSLIDVARLIEQICISEIKNEVLNFGGKQRVSRADLGEILCRAGGYDSSLIEKISMNDIPGIQKVPDVSMNTSRLNSYGLYQKSIEESITEILKSTV
ncbi:MAG: SDR family oxidoreductase [Ignavibacteria bacterium]|nr:SDR family oxidoreductase [Ignavibacteria bacterium]